MESDCPPGLAVWHDRVARLRRGQETVGYLLIEAVHCHSHPPDGDPVWELEWTACLPDEAGRRRYEGDIRLDWRQALAELAGGSCPWVEPPAEVDWPPPVGITRLREEYFD